MLILHNRASMERALAIDPETPVGRALRRRIEGLSAGAHDRTDETEIIVAQPGDTLEAFAREADFLPTADPLSGARPGEPGFQPAWDHLSLADGVWDAVFTFGSTCKLILLVPDGGAALPELVGIFRASRPS